jgi:hypothetical protein
MDTSDVDQGPDVDQLIEQVRQWLATGLSRDEVAARLAELVASRTIVQTMDVILLRTMAHIRSDDFATSAVLRATEAALRLVPRADTEPP